jgi:uncharacterized protein YcbK (DUF882 family)
MRIQYDHWSKVGNNVWNWPNFTPKEIACKGTGELVVVLYAMDCLQELRNTLGRPIRITSAYRSRLHNARVGGVPFSAHRALVPGVLAFDILLHNQYRDQLYHQAQLANFTGFGFYKSFLHVDTGRPRTWGSWT